jgi:predicted lysophospholipase L1 biosynthesis ABC-type transport system permease subunit
LYENIFIEEETADIALLKSMGFKQSVIRGWHLIRLTILGVLSMGLSILFTATIGNKFAETLFVSLLRNYSFKLTVDPIHNFVIVPLIVISGLVIAVYLMTRLTDSIRIWKVRTE